MSWEVQGRQYHQWFGHGTGDAAGVQGAGRAARDLGPEDVAAMVAAGAAASMVGERRANYQGYLDRGGLKGLSQALAIWAAASGLDAERFRSVVVGARLPAGSAMALQEAGRLIAGARDVGDLQAASERLAEAVEGGGADWRYGLRFAQDQAKYGAAKGWVPRAVRGDEGLVFRIEYAPQIVGAARDAASMAGDGVNLERLAGIGRVLLSRLGPWGALAAVVLGVAGGAYVLWRRSGESEGAAGTTVRPHVPGVGAPSFEVSGRREVRPRFDDATEERRPDFSITAEMRPPGDAKDPHGAKAPGKPGPEVGFKDPKRGKVG